MSHSPYTRSFDDERDQRRVYRRVHSLEGRADVTFFFVSSGSPALPAKRARSLSASTHSPSWPPQGQRRDIPTAANSMSEGALRSTRAQLARRRASRTRGNQFRPNFGPRERRERQICSFLGARALVSRRGPSKRETRRQSATGNRSRAPRNEKIWRASSPEGQNFKNWRFRELVREKSRFLAPRASDY